MVEEDNSKSLNSVVRSFPPVQGEGGGMTPAGVGVQVNPRTGSRLKAEVRCDGVPLPPPSPRFARHNHNHLSEYM